MDGSCKVGGHLPVDATVVRCLRRTLTCLANLGFVGAHSGCGEDRGISPAIPRRLETSTDFSTNSLLVDVLAFWLRKPPRAVITRLSLVALSILGLSCRSMTGIERAVVVLMLGSLSVATCGPPLTFCFLRLHSVHDVVVLSAREALGCCIASGVGPFNGRRSETVYRLPLPEDDVSYRGWTAFILARKGRRRSGTVRLRHQIVQRGGAALPGQIPTLPFCERLQPGYYPSSPSSATVGTTILPQLLVRRLAQPRKTHSEVPYDMA